MTPDTIDKIDVAFSQQRRLGDPITVKDENGKPLIGKLMTSVDDYWEDSDGS